mgnify:CR=1 FL=1
MPQFQPPNLLYAAIMLTAIVAGALLLRFSQTRLELKWWEKF